MKKTILVSVLLLLSINLFAQLGAEDEFEGPKNALNLEGYISRVNGVLEIDLKEAMDNACDGDSCVVFEKRTDISGWDFEVTLGEDSRNNTTTATRSDGSVVVINTPTDGNSTLSDDNQFYGITLSYKNYKCKQSVNTTRQSYLTLNTFQKQMVNEDGSIKRVLDPSQRTMLMYLTALVEKLDGNSCNFRD